MVRRKTAEASLVGKTSLRVRFSEVDSMQIVWHGEYVRYFEDGREAFGREFAGLGYMDIHASGYTAPIVELQLQYKKPLRVNDTAVVETAISPPKRRKYVSNTRSAAPPTAKSSPREARRRCFSTPAASCSCSRRSSTANGRRDGT